MRVSSLGVLSVLTLTSAYAAEPGYELTYEAVRKDGAWELRVYAENKGEEKLVVDDNPYVMDVTLARADGHTVALDASTDMDLMSRAGPRRRWMTVAPGQKLLVGTTELTGTPAEGLATFKVRVVTPSAYKDVAGAVRLGDKLDS